MRLAQPGFNPQSGISTTNHKEIVFKNGRDEKCPRHFCASLFVSMQDEYKVLINLGSSGPSSADNFISGLIQKPYLAAKCAVLCSIS